MRAAPVLVLIACCAGVPADALQSLAAPGLAVEFRSADRSRAERVPAVIAAVRRELDRALGLPGPERTVVRLVRDPTAFTGISYGRPVELYAGIAYPGSSTILINAGALDRDGTPLALARTLRHEFVHLALGHALGEGRLPRWFEEGLACAFGSPLPADAAAQATAATARPLPSLDRFPRNRVALSAAYAQSESVVRFLIAERSVGDVRELLGMMRSGRSFESALEGATGFGVESLDAAWRRRFRPSFGFRILQLILGPGRLFLWTALLVVVGYFFVRARRRRAAEELDRFP